MAQLHMPIFLERLIFANPIKPADKKTPRKLGAQLANYFYILTTFCDFNHRLLSVGRKTIIRSQH